MKTLKLSKRYLQIAQISAIIAAILYCSWPLGPLLNPAASRHGLASELGAYGQPWNWVFIWGDVVAGLLLILSCVILWRIVQANKVVHIVLSSAIIFGAGTVADALLPLGCLPSLKKCPTVLHDPMLLGHAIFGLTASFVLFVGLTVLWVHARKSIVLSGLMLGYIFFGIVSLIEAIFPGQGNWSQHFYITLCSVVMAVLPWAVARQAGLRK